MSDNVTITTTSDQKPALRQLIRNLPGILSGRFPDVSGIARGFRTRIGFKILGFIVPNFDNLGRGLPGVDGNKWPPLSPKTLAYSRRFGPGEKTALKKKAGLGKEHRFGVGGNKGLLTKPLQKLWNKTYADRLAWYIMREPDEKAKNHAAAIAWIVVKAAGGKTQLQVYGNREVQVLVDTGRGRASLTPGQMTSSGPSADYVKSTPTYQTYRGRTSATRTRINIASTEDQVFDATKPDQIVVGTNVGYMGAHHRGNKRLPRRRLWPETFPSEWWTGILGEAISGLVRIGDLFRGSKPL